MLCLLSPGCTYVTAMSIVYLDRSATKWTGLSRGVGLGPPRDRPHNERPISAPPPPPVWSAVT